MRPPLQPPPPRLSIMICIADSSFAFISNENIYFHDSVNESQFGGVKDAKQAAQQLNQMAARSFKISRIREK